MHLRSRHINTLEMNYPKFLLTLFCCTLFFASVRAQNNQNEPTWLTPETSSRGITSKEIGQNVLIMTEMNGKRSVRKAILRDKSGKFYVDLNESERLIYVSLIGGTPTDDGYIDEQNFVMNRVGEAFTPAGISANEVVMAVKESAIDLEDVDLQSRVRHIPETFHLSYSHSSAMATTITGDGVSGPKARGVAPGGIVYSIGYGEYIPEPTGFYRETGVRVQNHSYSASNPIEYGIQPAEYDRVAAAVPDLLFIASAGNRALDYDSLMGEFVPRFSTISAEYKMAKNMLLIGAQGDEDSAQWWSSRGPTVDNRLKPDFVVYGRNGTSGAAAITSGFSMLLREAYKSATDREEASSALMRAVMIASAVPVSEVPGPSFVHGYGALDGEAAFEVIGNEQYYEEELAADRSLVSIPLVPAYTDRRLRVCLSWLDPPAEPGSINPLVNDLDLRIIGPDGEINLPWVWDEVGDPAETFGRPFGKARDRRNVNEVVDIDLPLSGEYRIEVSSSQAINQEFSVAYSYLEPILPLAWIGPNRDNPAPAENIVDLDWQGRGLTNDPVSLQWKPVDADEWQTITDSAYLNHNYYGWQAPEGLYGLVQARLLPPGELPVVSEVFLLSPRVIAEVHQNCAEAFTLEWSGLAPNFDYELVGYEAGVPQTVYLLNDTLLFDADLPATYYQVRPLHVSGYRGLESPLHLHNNEEGTCYLEIQYSGVERDGDIYITTILNNDYELAGVNLQRRDDDGNYVTLDFKDELSLNRRASTFWIDRTAKPGSNYYRFQIVLNDGSTLSGPSITITRAEGSLVAVPNPASESLRFFFDEGTLFSDNEIVVFDALGREVFTMSSIFSSLYLSWLKNGQYFAVLYNEGKPTANATFVVQH
jgi:hypothetical protein